MDHVWRSRWLIAAVGLLGPLTAVGAEVSTGASMAYGTYSVPGAEVDVASVTPDVSVSSGRASASIDLPLLRVTGRLLQLGPVTQVTAGEVRPKWGLGDPSVSVGYRVLGGARGNSLRLRGTVQVPMPEELGGLGGGGVDATLGLVFVSPAGRAGADFLVLEAGQVAVGSPVGGTLFGIAGGSSLALNPKTWVTLVLAAYGVRSEESFAARASLGRLLGDTVVSLGVGVSFFERATYVGVTLGADLDL